MRRRGVLISILIVGVVLAGGYAAVPYARALLLVIRAANVGGQLETFADRQARTVAITERASIPTRHGAVPARLYEPDGGFRRTILLIPGIHAAGIDEPRLTGLARDLAGSGVAVMTLALPDLRRYRITPNATDVIEDAVAWLSRQSRLAPDGQIGLIGVSFAGGLSIVAAGRDAIKDRVAFVVSFGGHGDLPRVMQYLCTGRSVPVEGLVYHRPHDYGVAVILYGIAHTVVPPEQVEPLLEGVQTFLLASQLTLIDRGLADATFEKARSIAKTLPEPSSIYLSYVNDRNVDALGRVLAPRLAALASDNPALSPQRAPAPPVAPVYLLHGANDAVIPAAESVLLAQHFDGTATVRLLLSYLITHAEVDQHATAAEAWRLVAFWADVLQQ